ncbi:MAG TPA: RidA family protein [bacterium]|nr:RidA family protein [bacterium]HPN42063.1 RidA family protein [bacterium]
MSRKTVKTTKAPGAIGPYNQAVIWQGNAVVFTAGQLGINPGSGDLVTGGIEEQTRQALVNVQAVLEAAGSSLSRVLKTTVFLQNMQDFTAMNRVYEAFFPSDPPARSAVQVARLPKDALIEIEAIAGLDQ